MNPHKYSETINGVTYQLAEDTHPRAAELFWFALEAKPAATAAELMERISTSDLQFMRCEGGALSPVVKAAVVAADRVLMFVKIGEFHWGYRPLIAKHHFPYTDLPAEWQAPFAKYWDHYGACVRSITMYDSEADTIGV